MGMAMKLRDSYAGLNGSEKAAVMLLTLGEDRASPILERLEENEVRLVSRAMADLGTISASLLEDLIKKFTQRFAKGGSIIGSQATAERMLKSFLPADKVSDIMNYIKGPGGRSTWEKMAIVNEGMLAKYLQGEHPQTVAVVLSKVAPDNAARVLHDLPEELVKDVLSRMINLKSVPKEILSDIEEMLQKDLMMNYAVINQSNNFEHMAEILNRTEGDSMDPVFEALEERHPEAVAQIKQLMFTFDDLIELDSKSLSTVVRSCDTDTLVYALKGCDERVRQIFLSNMSERAGAILEDSIESIGPVLVRDVENAKAAILRKARELAESDAIVITREGAEQQLVY
ncbi:MAG: flagellar motor switch protein FliG [Pseudomonadota bacterium]